ncbi:MAG TPA: hypothetical protein VGM88_19790 [Kofleriaceae bacterium]|jgi:hypothetical protein
MRFSVGVVACALLLASARAHADSTEDLLGPREIAVGEAMRADATGAAAIGLNPSSEALTRDVVFDGTYGYRTSDSASLVGVSACDSTNAIPGCFFYHYAGTSPGDTLSTATHIAGITTSYTVLPRFILGAVGKYYHFSTNVPGQTGDSGFAFDFGATLRLTQAINVGVSGQNLIATTRSEIEMPRTLGGGISAKPIPILTLSFDMRWLLETDNKTMRYGGGAELNIGGGTANNYPIRAGILRDNGLDTTYLSGGLGYGAATWGLDVTYRRSIDGPTDNLVIGSIRLYGPRQPVAPLQ